MKKRFDITVMGQEFAVLSDKGDVHVESVVRYVNKRAQEIENASKNVSTLNIAILVALDIADEVLDLKEGKEHLADSIRDRIRALIYYIDEKTEKTN